ncbi:MAG: hypothetical protein ACR2PX_23060 [Endozoicomonas sp.]|uniref:hypothetical protein n=1 Tax=Endozoicomonas sp. TaxID=1892382 RepID=UPI003D9B3FBE
MKAINGLLTALALTTGITSSYCQPDTLSSKHSTEREAIYNYMLAPSVNAEDITIEEVFNGGKQAYAPSMPAPVQIIFSLSLSMLRAFSAVVIALPTMQKSASRKQY